RTRPGGVEKSRLARSTAGRSLAATVRRDLPPGTSLPLLGTAGERPAVLRTSRYFSTPPGRICSDSSEETTRLMKWTAMAVPTR
ncbi:hypothetical protein ACM9HD_34110, partial [Streptomyces sp. JAC25]